MNVHVQRATCALAIVGTLGFGAWVGSAAANADPVETINLSEIHNVDLFPVCEEEDCSDQPRQIGLWYSRSTGDWYLEIGESYTRRIVDDSVECVR